MLLQLYPGMDLLLQYGYYIFHLHVAIVMNRKQYIKAKTENNIGAPLTPPKIQYSNVTAKAFLHAIGKC